MELVFRWVLVCLFFSTSSVTAGKMSNCDDVEEYAKEIADGMLKGKSKDSRLHLYEPRYSVSNAIVSYVYSLEGHATPFRIGTLVYRRCQSGAYGSTLSDKGNYEPHVSIGGPLYSGVKRNSPEQAEKNQKAIADLIKKMN